MKTAEIKWFPYGSGRMAFNVKLAGATVCLRLNRAEIDHILQKLEELSNDPSDRDKARTTAWWEYEAVCQTEDPPPLMLYRDDWFSVSLTHEVGKEFLRLLKQVPTVIPEPNIDSLAQRSYLTLPN